MALEYDVPLITHIAETEQEVEEWRETYGMPVVPWIKKLGMLETKLGGVTENQVAGLNRSLVAGFNRPLTTNIAWSLLTQYIQDS